MSRDFSKELKENLQKSINFFEDEVKKIRTGRASTGLVENIKIDYYGTPTPLSQTASLTIPEPRTISIQPWDKSILKSIEKAIGESDLNLNPNNNGESIIINLPSLNEETRGNLVKILNSKAEEVKITLRSHREKTKKDIKNAELPEDEERRALENLDKIIKDFTGQIENIVAAKEKDILTI
jgi:ribosome recycling factor